MVFAGEEKANTMTLPVQSLASLALRKAPEKEICPYLPDDLQSILPGLQAGAITEITGTSSSGRTSLVLSICAAASRSGELCAYIDGGNSFDPISAGRAGVVLDQLLWVQCHHELNHALQSADMILHGGGFRVLVLDLGQFSIQELQRVPLSWWHRLRLAVENTPTVLVLLGHQAIAKQAAATQVELRRKEVRWSGNLLTGLDGQAVFRKPMRKESAVLRTRAAGEG